MVLSRALLLCMLLSLGCTSTISDADPGGDGGLTGTAISATVIARACLLAVGCGAAPVGSIGACVQSMTRRALVPEMIGEDLWDRLLECSARPSAAATCEAFVDCATQGHSAAYCAAHPGESCDRNVAVHCGANGAPATADDCATIPNGRCRPPSEFTYSLAVCAAGCSPTCAGNVASLDCTGITERARRCTAGTTCIISPSFAGIFGACLPPGPTCAATAARCDGSVLVRCSGVFESVLRETRSDCARLGWRCASVGEGATCVPPPFACALDGPPHCEGDTLVACAAGSDPRFNCRALGFERCAPASKSGPAHCEL